MNRNFVKRLIAAALTLIMAISMVSMTAFAAENPKIYVGLSYDDSANTLTATIKAKSTETQISGGAAFISYDSSKLTADASSINLVQSGIKHFSEGTGCIGAAWYSIPPIEAGDSYTTIATITFALKDGVSLADLDGSSISRCDDYNFLQSQGGYGKYGCGYIIDENNTDHSVNSDTLSFVIGDSPEPEPEPETVAVTGVDITSEGYLMSGENLTVKLGETIDFDAHIYPDDATDHRVGWTSSDTAVATIDENGVVTPLTAGTTTITVTTNDGGFTDKCTVTVVEKEIESIAETKISTTIGTAPVLPTTVTATYDDKSTGEVKVTWEKIKAEKYAKTGTFEVSGTVEGTDIKAKCVVTVNEKQPAVPTITKIAPVEVSTFIGSIPTLPEKVTVTYSDDTTKSVKVTWGSVSADNYTKAKCVVTVSEKQPAGKEIKSIADAKISTTVGTAPVLPTTVTATYDDKSTGEVKVTWEKIKAEKYAKTGTFEVSGTVEGTDIKAKCVVTVNEKQPAVPTITKIAPVEVSTFIGSIPTLPEKVTVTYSDDTTKSVKVTWGSVSADNYTKAGSFDVEGTVEGTSIKAKCTVKVTDPKEIVAIKASEISTKVNSVPTLPKTVTVTYADKTTGTADVTWETIDSAALSKAGTFTIKGTVKGTNLTAECKITVKKGSNGDTEKNDTPKTGDSIIGVAIAGLIFLVSMMIMFMCAGAIKKNQPVKESSANLKSISGLMRFAPKSNRSLNKNKNKRYRYNTNRNNRENRR